MLLFGDCLEILRHWPDDTFDIVCTDPPYGLAFMNKHWDHGVPGVEYWREVLRVAKPGAFLTAFGGTRTHHRLVCAIEDAGWEVRDCLMWLYGCVDEHTECLTRRGWLRHDELRDDDEVMQWNHETDELSWCQPVEIVRFHHDGDLVVLRNRNTEQVLTPDHRVYAKVRRHSRHDKPESYEVVTAGELHGRPKGWQVDLPLAGELAGFVAVDPERAYLVGWWLTDAWRHSDGKACMFSQSKPTTLAKLRAALDRYGPSEYVKIAREPQHSDEHTFYVTGALADYLITNHPERALEWSMLDWTLAARRRLVEGLLDGDGTQAEKQHGGAFWSKKSERRDIFLALCVSIGWRAYDNPDDHCVYFNRNRQTTQIQAKHKPETLRYDGTVWCARVPAGAFVVRRSGRPFITGNTGFPKSLDVGKALDKAAGKERELLGIAGRSGTGRSCMNDAPGNGRKKDYLAGEYYATAPATDLAKLYDGYGTALKPSYEPVILARKPLVGTVAQTVQQYGTGGLNIDANRVKTADNTSRQCSGARNGVALNAAGDGLLTKEGIHGGHSEGRWPPNVLLGHVADCTDEACCEECPVRQLDEQSAPKMHSARHARHKPVAVQHKATSYSVHNSAYDMWRIGDSGGAARFFPRFYYSSKTSRKERAGSTHPTVKPLAIVEWLLRLTAPPGKPVVLDPFVGSGTTLIAAHNLGIEAVGIEKEAEYVEQAYRRWQAICKPAA